MIRENGPLKAILSGRILAMWPLGFSSGLPLALSSGTLQAWLATSNVDIRSIGLFSLAGLPYTLKFLWSPLLDRFLPPFLGRRRGWICCFQLLLSVTTFFLGLQSPKNSLVTMGVLAMLLALFSASQDIVIDAYRTDILLPRERGLGAGIAVTAYRLAMLVSGALALILGDKIGWNNTYILMAAIFGALAVCTPFTPEPSRCPRPRSMLSAIREPILEFMKRRRAISILILIVLYKIGDAFCGTLTTAFLIKGAGFTPTDVGVINKGMGLLATIAGAVGGGALMQRLGLFRGLMYFGILQAVSNLSFMALSQMGRNYPMLIGAVGLENLSGGMGTAAFVAFLMALCKKEFSATQYALLSALASIGRVFVGPPSGMIVAHTSWSMFFFMTFLAAMPGLFLLQQLRDEIMDLE